ncbi:hypothetical protein F5Y00DRAFT_92143 [Daldinia vernicosa]|uniref:uncharacterized protein n=1 Tax=Daldinia vernicosa TaxID=114800 RepID=UPI0020075606|nr:uncharacterized protein F5Y00DRAFT_92143 [Daldinia vernicosa]KAI0848126.1 hypothetical protein F5Y00DRAFT_92143 [Daldinia vernicosa]
MTRYCSHRESHATYYAPLNTLYFCLLYLRTIYDITMYDILPEPGPTDVRRPTTRIESNEAVIRTQNSLHITEIEIPDNQKKSTVHQAAPSYAQHIRHDHHHHHRQHPHLQKPQPEHSLPQGQYASPQEANMRVISPLPAKLDCRSLLSTLRLDNIA